MDYSDLDSDHKMPVATVTWKEHMPTKKKNAPRKKYKVERLILPRGKFTDGDNRKDVIIAREHFDDAFHEHHKVLVPTPLPALNP